MANLRVSTRPLISSTTPYPPAAGATDALRSAKRSVSPQLASALEATAAGMSNIQSSLNSIHATLRGVSPDVHQIYVTDNTGKVIAAIGDFEYAGVVTPNYFSEMHVGDPLGTGDPSQALFNAVDGRVTIGQNGIVEVLDPFGADAAWIGAQADTLPVTGAANNGAGLIRLTVTGHTLATGDVVPVMNVGGVPNATGIFTVTKIDANHVDLQSSVFVGAYTSGGTINRLLHITGAANNGAGLIRITIAGHGYTTGDRVNIVSVGGVPNATGQWTITVITANTFDLQASTFGGAYTSGGTCLRFFAGMLAQTIAIGPSFANYRLRAFADGSLRIQNATIALAGTNGTILLDPTGPTIAAIDTSGNTAQITPGQISITAATTNPQLNENSDAIDIINSTGQTVMLIKSDTAGTESGMINITNNNGTASVNLDPSNADAVTTTGGGNINSSGVLKVSGTQVVGAQMAAVASPAITTSNTASTAGAAYTATEQAMLNALKNAVGQLNVDVVNLKAAVDGIRAVQSAALGGHGLTA